MENGISTLQYYLILTLFVGFLVAALILTFAGIPPQVGLLMAVAAVAMIVALTIGELRAPSRVALLHDRIEFINRLGRKHDVEYDRFVGYRTYRMPGGQRVFIFFHHPRKWIFGYSPLTVTEEIGMDLLDKTGLTEFGDLTTKVP